MNLAVKKGYRKVVYGAVIMAIGVGVEALAPRGLSDNLLDLLKYISVAFFSSNGIEHLAESMKLRLMNSDVTAKLTTIDGRIATIEKANQTTQEGMMQILTLAQQPPQGPKR